MVLADPLVDQLLNPLGLGGDRSGGNRDCVLVAAEPPEVLDDQRERRLDLAGFGGHPCAWLTSFKGRERVRLIEDGKWLLLERESNCRGKLTQINPRPL